MFGLRVAGKHLYLRTINRRMVVYCPKFKLELRVPKAMAKGI